MQIFYLRADHIEAELLKQTISYLVNPCRFVIFVEMETEEEAREEGISEAVHAQMQAKWKELSKKRWESISFFIYYSIAVVEPDDPRGLIISFTFNYINGENCDFRIWCEAWWILLINVLF